MTLMRGMDLMKTAQRGSYALGAFNAQNWDYVKGIVEGAEAAGPCLLQLGEGTLDHTPINVAWTMAQEAVNNSPAFIGIHLDHAHSIDLCWRALDLGFTSIMFDGSRHEDEKNIELTRSVVERAHRYHVAVEGEIGAIDREDHVEVTRAVRFFEETGVDWLAAPFGTRHAGTPVGSGLNVDNIQALERAVPCPLVLHGSSGVAPAMVQQAIGAGVRKVNIGTALNVIYREQVLTYYQQDRVGPDPRPGWRMVRRTIAEFVASKISALYGARSREGPL